MGTTIDYSIKDLEKVVKGIDGTIKSVDISRLTAPGENYLSLVFRVDFEVEKDGRTETISTVAKRLPLGERKFDFNAIAMRNEIRWYTEIVPLFTEVGKEFGINTDYYPEYLGGRFSLDPTKTEADDESVLLLRNLIPDGYKNEDRYIGFDLITAKALLRVLAAFHAIPLVMKFKKPESFKILKDFLDTTRMEPPPHPDGKAGPPNGFPEGKEPPVGKILDKMLEIPACQPYIANIEALKLKPVGPPLLHKSGLEPWNTVAHGDFWVNNVMVSYQEAGPPLVKMVDFQTCSYGSYAKDVIFFLLSSVRNDIQKQHFDELVRYYYEELTSIIDKVDVPELKLPYEDYLAELKRVALESETGHALFFSTVIFGVKETGPDILVGEVDMFDHMEHMVNNMNEHQINKLGVITELAANREWM